MAIDPEIKKQIKKLQAAENEPKPELNGIVDPGVTDPNLPEVYDIEPGAITRATDKDTLKELMCPIKHEIEVVDENDQQHEEDVQTDYVYARTNLYSVIESGKAALEAFAGLIEKYPSPRSFEVFAAMMKTIVESNKELAILHKDVKELKEEDLPNDGNSGTTNNIVFAGSSQELAEFVKKVKSS